MVCHHDTVADTDTDTDTEIVAAADETESHTQSEFPKHPAYREPAKWSS